MISSNSTITRSAKRRMPKRERNNLIKGLLFIAPNYIGFILFTLAPMLIATSLSFFSYRMGAPFSAAKFIGLKNFIALITDQWFYNSFFNTIYVALGTVPVTMALALMFAYLLDHNVFFKRTLRTMVFTPYVTNIVATSYIWMTIFQPSFGPINNFLRQFTSNPPQWLSSATFALPTIMMMQIWLNVGYATIIYLAALQNIPQEILDASRIDGANTRQEFFHIVVPLVSPTTFFIFVTLLITALRLFGPVNLLTGGGPGSSSSVLAFYSYLSAFSFYKMGYASAIATVLFLLIFIITLIQWKFQDKWVNYS